MAKPKGSKSKKISSQANAAVVSTEAPSQDVSGTANEERAHSHDAQSVSNISNDIADVAAAPVAENAFSEPFQRVISSARNVSVHIPIAPCVSAAPQEPQAPESALTLAFNAFANEAQALGGSAAPILNTGNVQSLQQASDIPVNASTVSNMNTRPQRSVRAPRNFDVDFQTTSRPREAAPSTQNLSVSSIPAVLTLSRASSPHVSPPVPAAVFPR